MTDINTNTEKYINIAPARKNNNMGMSKLRRVAEVSYIFGTKAADIISNKVLKGSKSKFLKLQLSELILYPTNIIAGRIPSLRKYLEKKQKNRKNEEYIIKNSKGLFAVNSLNDSLTISSKYYDPFQKKWLKTQKKKIFLDIGANIGHYSLLASKEGFSRIICFEPDPDTYNRLCKNISLNKLKNVKAYNIGVGNTNGKLPFSKDEFNTGGNRFVESKKVKQNKNQPLLEVVKLDDFLPSHKIKSEDIDFIKIDVEGFELDVLKGMQKTLNSLSEGTILMIEIWDRSTKKEEAFDIIKKNKFRLIKKYDDNYLYLLERKNTKRKKVNK